MNILIIGYGVVGQNMERLFPGAYKHDPGMRLRAPEQFYDVAFVCVPTPPREDGSCDTSIVEAVIAEWCERVGVFCIKSTVPPGTTDRIGGRAVFSPEFFGATQHANAVDYDFVILGGRREHTAAVAEAYKERMTGALRIAQTDAKTAELVKYAENSFLALKVTFFNEWARVCRAFGEDFNEFRELLLLDPRIGRSHSFSYSEHPYYDSHCLTKDIPAIIRATEAVGCDMHLMKKVRALNDSWKARAAFERDCKKAGLA